jgi:hypothetical protein
MRQCIKDAQRVRKKFEANWYTPSRDTVKLALRWWDIKTSDACHTYDLLLSVIILCNLWISHLPDYQFTPNFLLCNLMYMMVCILQSGGLILLIALSGGWTHCFQVHHLTTLLHRNCLHLWPLKGVYRTLMTESGLYLSTGDVLNSLESLTLWVLFLDLHPCSCPPLWTRMHNAHMRYSFFSVDVR